MDRNERAIIIGQDHYDVAQVWIHIELCGNIRGTPIMPHQAQRAESWQPRGTTFSRSYKVVQNGEQKFQERSMRLGRRAVQTPSSWHKSLHYAHARFYSAPLDDGLGGGRGEARRLGGSEQNLRGQRDVQLHVRKIAVLRANAIGDFLLILPALAALRTRYPDAEIVLLGRHWHADFLDSDGVVRPGPVDRVIVVPYNTGVYEPPEPWARESPAELAHFFASMRAERFDLALQLHGGGRFSNPFVLQLGARFTAGLRTPDALPLDAWVPYIYEQHETLRSLEVVGLVGATTDNLEPHVVVTPSDRVAAAPFLATLRRPFAVLHPGASDPRRRWQPTNFAAVGDALAAGALDVVVIGGADEQDLAAAVVDAMQAPARNLAGHLSLTALTGLLADAQVMVANDSGPRHLAAAVGVPTVGIFWCGNLLNYGPLTRTFHRPVVSWRLHCPECGLDCTRGRCAHLASFVTDVAAEDVRATVEDVLNTVVRMGRPRHDA